MIVTSFLSFGMALPRNDVKLQLKMFHPRKVGAIDELPLHSVFAEFTLIVQGKAEQAPPLPTAQPARPVRAHYSYPHDGVFRLRERPQLHR